MKINEVEKLTGLSAKAIRLYESEQLITVNRSDNLYRDYDDEAIRQLLEIKLYRKLDIKISDLKQWKVGKASIETLLADCLDNLRKEEDDNNNKKDICKDLLKSIQSGEETDAKEYLDSFEFLESDEYEDLKKSVDELSRGSLFSQFFFSLILLGPIAWLFLNYYGLKNYEALSYNIPWAIFSIIVLSLSWSSFLRKRTCSLRNTLKGILKIFIYVVSFIIVILGAIAFFALINQCLVSWVIPHDYIIYILKPISMVAFFFFLLEIISIVIFFTESIKNRNKSTKTRKPLPKKIKYIIIAINILMIYIVPSNLLIVTPDNIINSGFLNPQGKSYAYSDIELIHTGMNKDVLFYEVRMTDDKTFEFADSDLLTMSPGYEEDHVYLLKIDQLAMNSGDVKKVVDTNKIKTRDESIKEIFNNR